MILTQQIGSLVEDVKDDMTNGSSGTGTALFTKTQTGLISEVAASDLALTDKTFTSSSVSVTHVIGTGTANSNTLAEFEVNNGVSSYNRTVKAPVAKTSDIEITTIHTFDFEIVS